MNQWNEVCFLDNINIGKTIMDLKVIDGIKNILNYQKIKISL